MSPAISKGAAATPPFCVSRMLPKSRKLFSDKIMRT